MCLASPSCSHTPLLPCHLALFFFSFFYGRLVSPRIPGFQDTGPERSLWIPAAGARRCQTDLLLSLPRPCCCSVDRQRRGPATGCQAAQGGTYVRYSCTGEGGRREAGRTGDSGPFSLLLSLSLCVCLSLSLSHPSRPCVLRRVFYCVCVCVVFVVLFSERRLATVNPFPHPPKKIKWANL